MNSEGQIAQKSPAAYRKMAYTKRSFDSCCKGSTTLLPRGPSSKAQREEIESTTSLVVTTALA